MLIRIFSFILVISVSVLTSSCDQKGEKDKYDEVSPQTKENTAVILKKISDYVDGINSKDSNSLGDYWSDKAVYKNPTTGELISGKKGMSAHYEKIFRKMKDGKVEIHVKKIRFPIKEKAVEEGTSILKIPGQTPIEKNHKMIFIKENGDWHLLHASQLGFGVDES
jgi:ketosteroid isomerase-like protein